MKTLAKRRLLIIDPIFRGSRLYYSAMAAAGAFACGWEVHILTRGEAETEHYFELFEGIPVTLHRNVPLPEGFWYGKIGPEAVEALIGALILLHKEFQFERILAVGLNELNREFTDACLTHRREIKAALGRTPLVAIEYDARYLLRGLQAPAPRNPLERLRREFRVWLRRERQRQNLRFLRRAIPGLRVAVLDERAFDRALATRTWRSFLVQLPDPPPRFVGPAPLGQTLRQHHDRIRVLLVGLQSKRKGIEDFSQLLQARPNLKERFQFVLCGSLVAESEHLRPKLAAACKTGVLEWIDEYLPEAEIQRRYGEADYVLLPYARDFESSSGVMANAARSGKPIVATDHGCVGYRVQRFGMGFVYPSANIAKMAEVLFSLRDPAEAEYQKLSANCINYAQNNSVGEFQRILLSA
ncbi:glycosyltransferase involved in cell wall biosynthesis [Mesorhizobium robiniae]|uniref:Glycosyltransferase involved in cell wall biosynthesis n=1 Tax=Mesorhizobium robiniae TaxID=559315 RepID=A0ABV2GPE1_9HYPH